MKNYIYKIARDNVKKNKKFYKYIFISIFFTVFMTTSASILVASFHQASFEEKAYTQGKWSVAIVDPTQEQIQSIQNNENVKTIGKLYYGGEVIYQGRSIGKMGSYDEQGYQLANLHFIQGRMAKDENEIVIEQSLADGLKVKLNQEIKLSYRYDHHEKQSQFKVVGIIEDYSKNWCSRSLNFITVMKSEEYDLLIDAQYTVHLWNSLLNIKEDNMIFNTMNYPELEYSIPSQMYVDNSSFIIYMFEIAIVSLIPIISTMISSLNKREGQFILLRCIGATFKQIQKMIIWESLVVSLYAFVLAVLSGGIVSYLLMLGYSLLLKHQLVYVIQLSSLCVQLIICAFTIAIGTILPSLTVYDLPLTRKVVDHVNHSKKKKIRKPTFLSLIQQEMSRSYIMTVLISILVGIVFMKINLTVYRLQGYHHRYQYIQTYEYEGDFVVNSDIDFKDLKPLMEKQDIQVQCYLQQWVDLKWQDMDKEDELIKQYRQNGEEGYIICINQNLEKIINEHQIDGRMIRDKGEAFIMIPHRYYQKENDEIIIEKTGVKAKDTGLKPGKTIEVDYEGKKEQFKIAGVIDYEDPSNDLFDYYVIVNAQTYKQFINNDIVSKIIVNVKNEVDRSYVQSYFNELALKYSNIEVMNKVIDIQNSINILNEETIKDIIYTILLLVLLIFMIYLMKLLSSTNLRNYIGILNAIGMTKKKIYLLYFVQATLLFIVTIFIISIGFGIMYNPNDIAYSFSLIFHKEFEWHIKILCTLFVYGLYMMCMLMPIRNILREKTLNLIQKTQ